MKPFQIFQIFIFFLLPIFLFSQSCENVDTSITSCLNTLLNSVGTTDMDELCQSLYTYIFCIGNSIRSCSEVYDIFMSSMSTYIDMIEDFCPDYNPPVYQPVPPRVITGFGDPHFQILDGTWTTCNKLGTNVLLAHQFFSITAEFVSAVNPSTGPTVIESIQVTVYDPKNIQNIIFTCDDMPTDQVWGKGQSLITYEGTRLSIPRVGTYADIECVGGYMLFGISTSIGDEALEGIFIDGCGMTLSDEDVSSHVECESLSEYYKTACNYDMDQTGDVAFALHGEKAKIFVDELKLIGNSKVGMWIGIGVGGGGGVIVVIVCVIIISVLICGIVKSKKKKKDKEKGHSQVQQIQQLTNGKPQQMMMMNNQQRAAVVVKPQIQQQPGLVLQQPQRPSQLDLKLHQVFSDDAQLPTVTLSKQKLLRNIRLKDFLIMIDLQIYEKLFIEQSLTEVEYIVFLTKDDINELIVNQQDQTKFNQFLLQFNRHPHLNQMEVVDILAALSMNQYLSTFNRTGIHKNILVSLTDKQIGELIPFEKDKIRIRKFIRYFLQ